MAHTIAQKSLEGFIQQIGDTIWADAGLCQRRAANRLLTGLVSNGSPLVTQLAKALGREKPQKGMETSEKGRQERISGWLNRYDFVSDAEAHLLTLNAEGVSSMTPIALDFSDLSKPWGGEGMEGMERGYDASTKTIRMGHTLVAAVIPGETDGSPVKPLFLSLLPGRKGVIAHMKEACDRVMQATHGKGILIIDRGADAQEIINHLQIKGYRFIIRVNALDRETFDGPNSTPQHLSSRPGTFARKGHLNGLPITVVRHNTLNDKGQAHSLFYYTNCERYQYTPMRYRLRWSIETFFRDIKQLFHLESACVRTFQRLSNLVALITLAYDIIANRLRNTPHHLELLTTIQHHLRRTLGFSHEFRLFLVNLRALLLHLFHPGGRPRKHPDPRQLDFLVQLE